MQLNPLRGVWSPTRVAKAVAQASISGASPVTGGSLEEWMLEEQLTSLWNSCEPSPLVESKRRLLCGVAVAWQGGARPT